MFLPELPKIFTPAEIRLILQLRLLIARAANNDSLRWWDDQSLTQAGSYVLERLFPVLPPVTARSLALLSAFDRHRDACHSLPNALHLYRLAVDNVDKLVLRFQPLEPVPVVAAPITTMPDLRRELLVLLESPPKYKVVRRTKDTRALEITLPPPANDESPLVQRAKTLAWAYLEGAPDEPVFPFCAG